MAELVIEDRPQIREINRFTMFTNAPGADNRRSKFAWCIRDGFPRLTVYTNIPSDTISKGIITAPMNPETFFAFLDKFEQLIEGPNGKKIKVLCYTAYKDENGNGGTVADKVLLSEVWAGKDENGIVWISLVAKDRPKIKFEYRISDFHEIYDAEGQPITEQEASKLQALGTIRPMKNIYASLVNGFRQSKPQTAYQPKPQSSSKVDLSFDDDVF